MVNGAERLYTDDKQLAKFARRIKLDVVHVEQLPMPPPEQIGINL